MYSYKIVIVVDGSRRAYTGFPAAINLSKTTLLEIT